jgi:hypothetical protein
MALGDYEDVAAAERVVIVPYVSQRVLEKYLVPDA